VVGAGQKAKANLSVTNHGQEPVAVDRIETGCPCLTVTPSSIRLMPDETGAVAVEFDPSSEPDFRGGLAVDITGYADAGVVFRTKATLTVVSGRSGAVAPGEQEEPS
jgi:hypothetical protein